jgi:hypothetical protein
MTICILRHMKCISHLDLKSQSIWLQLKEPVFIYIHIENADWRCLWLWARGESLSLEFTKRLVNKNDMGASIWNVFLQKFRAILTDSKGSFMKLLLITLLCILENSFMLELCDLGRMILTLVSIKRFSWTTSKSWLHQLQKCHQVMPHVYCK